MDLVKHAISFNARISKQEARRTAKEIWQTAKSSPGVEEALLTNLMRCYKSLPDPRRVLAFLPMGDEVDIRAFMAGLHADVYIPRVTGPSSMEFCLYRRAGRILNEAVPGYMDIPGAPPGAETLAAGLDKTDLVIVPSLGANPSGTRLGRGGGYYDRWRDRIQRANKLAVIPGDAIHIPFAG
ncbi:MAG: hypothetical protein HY042_06640, partial [Spirochaetia bacterium]|nr:hypothetical protein [Spirochaetia bacterium]